MRTSSTSTLAPGWWPHLAMPGWSGCQMANTNCRALRPPTAQPPANGVPCSPPKSCSPSPGASGRSPALFERAGGAEPVGLPACAAPRPRLPKNILKIFGPWTADVQGPRLNSCVMNVEMTALAGLPVKNRRAAALIFDLSMGGREAWLLAPEFWLLTRKTRSFQNFFFTPMP